MSARKHLGCLVAALALCAFTACKGKGDTAGKLEPRCEQLGKTCGDSDKHVDKIVSECKAAAKSADASCADKTLALYDCFEKELCGKADKVWAYEDLSVLADRKNVCAAERTAAASCGGKP